MIEATLGDAPRDVRYWQHWQHWRMLFGALWCSQFWYDRFLSGHPRALHGRARAVVVFDREIASRRFEGKTP